MNLTIAIYVCFASNTIYTESAFNLNRFKKKSIQLPDVRFPCETKYLEEIPFELESIATFKTFAFSMFVAILCGSELSEVHILWWHKRIISIIMMAICHGIVNKKRKQSNLVSNGNRYSFMRHFSNIYVSILKYIDTSANLSIPKSLVTIMSLSSFLLLKQFLSEQIILLQIKSIGNNS